MVKTAIANDDNEDDNKDKRKNSNGELSKEERES